LTAEVETWKRASEEACRQLRECRAEKEQLTKERDEAAQECARLRDSGSIWVGNNAFLATQNIDLKRILSFARALMSPYAVNGYNIHVETLRRAIMNYDDVYDNLIPPGKETTEP
jgi:hypothetical protein